MLVARHAVCIGLGIALGHVLTDAAGGVLRSYLYGIESHDLVTSVAMTVVLGTCAMLATAWPVYRVSRSNPAAALRHE
jgi:hypothetical protein